MLRPAQETRERSFQFRECLGRGGFGEVYRATMVSPGGLRNEVAVKILRDATPDAIKRLRDEGKLLAMLRHPAILRVHDLAGVDGKVALVTEYVDGDDFAVLIGPGNVAGRMPLRAAVEVIGTVAEALHVAFTTVPVDGKEPLRLVHRDIKPSNVRIGRHGEVKLLDFGIAWSQDADREAKTNANSTVGSLAYMAPERFGRTPIMSSADVYSLGCTLYEGVTGDRLVPEAVPVEMYQRAAQRQVHDAYVVEQLQKLPAELPTVLRELLTGMLAFSPADRPTAREVAALCERLADDLPGSRLRAWCRERAWPEDHGTRGPLTGHTLTEQSILTASNDRPDSPTVAQATLDLSLHTGAVSVTVEAEGTRGSTVPMPRRAEPAPEPPARRPQPVAWLAGTAVVILAACAVVGGWWLTLPAPEAVVPPEKPTITAPPTASVVDAAPEAPAEAPADPQDPAPADPIEAAPTEVPVAEPSAEEPATEPAVAEAPPADPPVVEAPPPVVEEAPKPPALPPGTFRMVGDVKAVQLRSASGATYGPGSVPVGTYDIYVDFGSGWSAQGRVDILSGGTATQTCNKLRYMCDQPKY
jgi:serine/threonine protein kinase